MEELVKLLKNAKTQECLTDEIIKDTMNQLIRDNYGINDNVYFPGLGYFMTNDTLHSLLNNEEEVRNSLPHEYQGLGVYQDQLYADSSFDSVENTLQFYINETYYPRTFSLDDGTNDLGRSAVGDIISKTLTKTNDDAGLTPGEYFKLYQRIKERKGMYVDDFI